MYISEVACMYRARRMDGTLLQLTHLTTISGQNNAVQFVEEIAAVGER